MVVAKPGGEPVQKFCSVPGVVAILDVVAQGDVPIVYLDCHIPLHVFKSGVDAFVDAAIPLEDPFPGRDEILAAMVLES